MNISESQLANYLKKESALLGVRFDQRQFKIATEYSQRQSRESGPRANVGEPTIHARDARKRKCALSEMETNNFGRIRDRS